MNEDRLTELELRFTNQQAQLDDLSSELFEQQKAMSALRAEVERLKARLESAEDRLPQPLSEPPPHY